MKKELTKNQVFIIKAIFLLLICVVITGMLVFSRQRSNENKEAAETKQAVTYEKGKLSIFEDKYTLFPDTDKIGVHENYMFVTEPRKQKTTVYDKKLQKKVTILDELALDYDGTNVLYNKNGIDTYFNDVNLGVRCISGHIKSDTEILCILPKNDDNLDNKLVSINPQDLTQTDIYASNYTLYYVSFLKNTLYIGGFSLQTKKNYLLVDGNAIEAQDRVNVVFEKGRDIYLGSFQNDLNEHTENEYKVSKAGRDTTIELIEKGKIVFQ
jgi:hypothetical protein